MYNTNNINQSENYGYYGGNYGYGSAGYYNNQYSTWRSGERPKHLKENKQATSTASRA